jgi:hypothetical protein
MARRLSAIGLRCSGFRPAGLARSPRRSGPPSRSSHVQVHLPDLPSRPQGPGIARGQERPVPRLREHHHVARAPGVARRSRAAVCSAHSRLRIASGAAERGTGPGRWELDPARAGPSRPRRRGGAGPGLRRERGRRPAGRTLAARPAGDRGRATATYSRRPGPGARHRDSSLRWARPAPAPTG